MSKSPQIRVEKAQVRIDITGTKREVTDVVTAVVADALKDVLPQANIDLFTCGDNAGIATMSRKEIQKRLLDVAKGSLAVEMVSVDAPFMQGFNYRSENGVAHYEGGSLELPVGIHRHVVASAAEVPPLKVDTTTAADAVVIKNADVTIVETC